MVSSQTSQGHLEQNSTMCEVSESNQDIRDPPRIFGKPPAGLHRPVQDNENEPVSSRTKGDLTKLTVSPRVELMLNNELFKKYLSRHGNLLEKMAHRQGRSRGTLKKAFSNLDLSKIDLEEELQSTDKMNRSLKLKTDGKQNEVTGKDSVSVCSLPSQNPATIRTKRSQSLTGTNDPHFNELQQALKIDEETANARSKSRRSKFFMPSFEEFKKSRKEKLKKGQEYVKDVLRNKENIPHSFITNLNKCATTVTSSRKLPKEPVAKESTTQKGIVVEDALKKETEVETFSKTLQQPTSHERFHRKLPNLENLSVISNKSSQQNCDVSDSHGKSEENQRIDDTHLTQSTSRKERLKGSESFCTRSPEVSICSPRRSKSLKTKGKDFKLDCPKSNTEDVDPLELSTDGNTVYATLNIFSTDMDLAAHTTDTEDDDEHLKDSPNDCQTANHCDCCVRKKHHNCYEDLSLKDANVLNSKTGSSPYGNKAPNRDLQHGETESGNGRIILRATRKRKLLSKQRKPKTDGINTGLSTVRTWPKLCSVQSVDTVTRIHVKIAEKPPSIHIPLNRSQSCEVFNFNNFSPFSPGTFSFPNSPSEIASFSFPSTDSSNPGSEIDMSTIEQEKICTAIERTNSFQSDSKVSYHAANFSLRDIEGRCLK